MWMNLPTDCTELAEVLLHDSVLFGKYGILKEEELRHPCVRNLILSLRSYTAGYEESEFSDDVWVYVLFEQTHEVLSQIYKKLELFDWYCLEGMGFFDRIEMYRCLFYDVYKNVIREGASLTRIDSVIERVFGYLHSEFYNKNFQFILRSFVKKEPLGKLILNSIGTMYAGFSKGDFNGSNSIRLLDVSRHTKENVLKCIIDMFRKSKESDGYLFIEGSENEQGVVLEYIANSIGSKCVGEHIRKHAYSFTQGSSVLLIHLPFVHGLGEWHFDESDTFQEFYNRNNGSVCLGYNSGRMLSGEAWKYVLPLGEDSYVDQNMRALESHVYRIK